MKPLTRPPHCLFALAVAAVVLCLFPKQARAAKGTPSYFDFNGTTGGFGSPSGTINYSSSAWSTSSAGTATTTAPVNDAQLTFGTTGSDLAGATFNLNLDVDTGFTGIAINSNSASITLSGTANTPSSAANSWTVASGSTLTITANYGGNNGFNNYNSNPLTLAGGGTINFGTAIGMNGTAVITQNNSGGTVNLQQTVAGGAPFQGGYNLTAGTLNFQSPNSTSTAFSSMASGQTFSINGGTIDNTSGASRTLNIGSGTYSIGGNFTFTGTNSLDLGSNSVSLGTSVRQITVNSSTLTIGGAISGTGGGITKLGGGTLLVTGTNTYSGATTVSGGTLEVGTGGSLANTSSVTVNTGGTLLLSGSGSQVNSSATVTLAGGTLTMGGTAGINTTVGALTLSSSSTIDFGTLAGGNTLSFADSHSIGWTGTLNIYNWTAGTDHLFFGNSSGGLTSGQLSNINLYSDGGSTLLGSGAINTNGEVSAAQTPEPSSVFVGFGMLSLVGYRERRWFLRCPEARKTGKA